MKESNNNNNKLNIYSGNSVRPITYIHIAINRLFNERRLDSYLTKLIKQKKIKSKKQADSYAYEVYEAVFTITSDLYLKKNEWNDKADYDKFDSLVHTAIRTALYNHIGIKPKVEKEDKLIKSIMSDIEDTEELYL